MSNSYHKYYTYEQYCMYRCYVNTDQHSRRRKWNMYTSMAEQYICIRSIYKYKWGNLSYLYCTYLKRRNSILSSHIHVYRGRMWRSYF